MPGSHGCLNSLVPASMGTGPYQSSRPSLRPVYLSGLSLLCYGIMIEFQRSAQLRPAKANMEPANQRPEVVSEYLHNECSLGRNTWALPRDLSAAATTHQPIQSYSRGGCARAIECNRSNSAHHRSVHFFKPFQPCWQRVWPRPDYSRYGGEAKSRRE